MTARTIYQSSTPSSWPVCDLEGPKKTRAVPGGTALCLRRRVSLVRRFYAEYDLGKSR